MKQMETLTLPNGTTYEIVDRQARNSIAKNHANPITETIYGTAVASKCSADSPLHKFRLFGKTTQVKTTGKNLMNDSEFVDATSQGITVVRNKDGSYTVTGTASTTNVAILRIGEIVMTAGTKYRIRGGKSSVRLSLRDYSMGDVYADDTGSGTSYTPQTDMTTYLYIRVESGASVNTTIKPMVYLDSVTNTSFEPYTGGVASPSAAYPQDLISCGNDGSININVLGVNLFDATTLGVGSSSHLEVSEDGYTIVVMGGTTGGYTSATAYINSSVRSSLIGQVLQFKADEITRTQSTVKSGPQIAVNHSTGTEYIMLSEPGTKLITIPEDAVSIQIGIYTNNTGTPLELENCVTVKGLSLSVIAAPWNKYIERKLTTINRTLRGIPVKSDGNWIDANGQQWLCDEIDFARGIHIQRVAEIPITEEVKYFTTLVNTKTLRGTISYALVSKNDGVGLCNVDALYQYSMNDRPHFYIENSSAVVFVPIDYECDFENKPVVVLGKLETPIDTHLTSEELALFEDMHTNYPGTTIVNNSGALMEVEYTADTKLWIQDYVSKMI